MTLSRVFSEIVFLPRLTECLILTCNSQERRSGWGSFNEYEGKKNGSGRTTVGQKILLRSPVLMRLTLMSLQRPMSSLLEKKVHDDSFTLE